MEAGGHMAHVRMPVAALCGLSVNIEQQHISADISGDRVREQSRT
jgi:hypothetical protein